MSANIDDGGPAFPNPVEFDANNQLVSHGSFGMTLRDWFAGQALNGIAQAITGARINQCQVPDEDYAQKWAFALADAMLAARKGTATHE